VLFRSVNNNKAFNQELSDNIITNGDYKLTITNDTNTENSSRSGSQGASQQQATQQSLKMDRVREMIPKKELEIEMLTKELDNLKNETPEYSQLQAATSRLKACYSDIGLDNANEVLKSSQQSSGRSRNERGFSFEDAAEAVIVNYLLPDLAQKEKVSVSDLLLVRNVKLGMASQKGSTAEIDCLVCVRSSRPESLSVGSQNMYRSGEEKC